MKCDILKKNTINDKDFLKLMTVHHKAAVDMSKLISKTSKNDIILDFSRKIIFNQSKEIYLMNTLLNDSALLINNNKTINKPLNNIFENHYPYVFKNLKCDESHFNFNSHKNHNMNDYEYVNHMISHHNTALLLSKLLIESTKNSQLLIIAQTINMDQSKEIFELYFLKKSLKNHWMNKFVPFKDFKN